MKVAQRVGPRCVAFGAAPFLILAACSGPSAQTHANDSANATHDDRAALASLDPKSAKTEEWMSDDAVPQPVSVLYFSPQNFQLSASCKQSGGALSCDALRYLTNGMPAEIPKREIDGQKSIGRAICVHLGNTPFTAKNPVGSVQSFCRFPDGSFSTLAALEQHSLRIIQ